MKERVENIHQCKVGQLNVILHLLSLNPPKNELRELRKSKMEIKSQIKLLELILKP